MFLKFPLVSFLYIESDLVPKNKKSIVESESYYESYLKPNADGIILNNQEQRYDRNHESLVNQLIKFVN